MNTIADVRRANLRFLIERDGLSSVARRAGKPDRQLNDMVAGRKSFGEKVARAIELNLDPSLKPGWLDSPIYDRDADHAHDKSGVALLPSSSGATAERPSDLARVQPAKKATESGAPPVLSPAVHALIETVRPLPDDDLALLTQIARRMARGGIGEKTRRLIESDGQDAGLEGLLSTQAITRNKKKTPI